MEYITIKEAAERWGLSVRRVQDLCKQGAVSGATLWERTWMIPLNASRPERKRKGDNSAVETRLPRNTSNPFMSNLYNTPGTAEKVAESISDYPESATLFNAHLSYMRGDISSALKMAESLITDSACFSIRTGAAFLLCRCAMWEGSIELWTKSKNYMKATPVRNNKEKQRLDFWLAATESAIYDITGFPEWFCKGSFEFLPADTYPSARFYYLKYIYTQYIDLLKQNNNKKECNIIIKIFPAIAEPFISQSHIECAVLSELYQRILCAVVYHIAGDQADAEKHIDKALEIALPDKLLVPLAEYCHLLDNLLYDRLSLVAPELTSVVRQLQKKLMAGWIPLHNVLLNRVMSDQLTIRERQIARLAVHGLSNKEISQRLHISIDAVKQLLRLAMNKTGANNRKELGLYI